MRLLRDFADERAAELVRDALADQGVESDVKPASDGRFAVWVIDESHMPKANGLAAQWLDQGDTAALEEAARKGRTERELKTRIEQRKQKQMEAMAQQVRATMRPRPAPLTIGLLALCVGVGILTELGAKRAMVAALTIADPTKPVGVTQFELFGRDLAWLALPWDEPWRLVTPVLVHFGIIHILFNMLMLRDLGRIVESVHGARYLSVFVVVCGALSNIAQYEIEQNALFAGMSGVVYGLLGLVWTRGRLDPRAPYALSPSTVRFMLVWLVFGFIWPMKIANWCHVFGLLVGMAWGYLAAKLSRVRR